MDIIDFTGEVRGGFKEGNKEITTVARPNQIMAQLSRSKRQGCALGAQKARRNGNCCRIVVVVLNIKRGVGNIYRRKKRGGSFDTFA